jgi:dihydropteroate synthase
MIPKTVFKCIKLKNIPARSANLIKQEMLAKGGEAAVAKNSINNEGTTDILLAGTLKQYRLLINKLKLQPFGLKAIAGEIDSILDGLEKRSWNMQLAHGRTLEIGKRTIIMGILNVTPDSFSDGGRFFDPDKAIEHALQMAADGADIIDIGGASSRPNSIMVNEDEELQRILPVIKGLAARNIIMSVDTFRARVAEAALLEGAHIINDIGSLKLDSDLVKVLSKWQTPVVIMHNRMQINSELPYDDVISNIIADLQQIMDTAITAGLVPEKIIIDPGLGFVQSSERNLLIIKRLQDFRSLGRPILIGASRKSFIGRILNMEADGRLEGSLAAAVMAIMNGANIVRVHDVKETKKAALITDAVRMANG